MTRRIRQGLPPPMRDQFYGLGSAVVVTDLRGQVLAGGAALFLLGLPRRPSLLQY
jgi:hypothetical protein